MISPRVDRLLDNVDSPYASVVVAAKRARQINSYYHNLGEGTFEEFPPADDRHRVEELPHDRPRGSRGRQAQVPLPRLIALRPAMARILLGVTGGIAAYKALELTRLATKAGHAVRVIQTEAATRFVGSASFAALTGAPVLQTEWEPDPLRGAFPGEEPPAHAPLSHLELVERADVYASRPPRPTRWPSSPPARPTTCCAPPRSPAGGRSCSRRR